MGNFDPHYQWLGIPPAQQPANHYRLLGLTNFEPDASVIENAADQRTLLIRNVSSGPHAQVAQKLLNEVSAAKLVLIDPQRKMQYDQQLRQSARPSPIGEMPVESTSVVVNAQSEEASPVVAPLGSTHAARVRVKRRKKQSSTMTYAIGAGAVVLVAALFFVVGGLSESDDEGPDEGPTASIRLKSITDQTATVGTELVIQAKTKTDGDLGDVLKFVLESGSPASATIDKKTGEIRWKPSSRDGGRKHSIRVRAKAGDLSDTMRFAVVVPKLNSPPRISNIVDRQAEVGRAVALQIRASVGRGGGPVTYRLVSELPGARVGSQSGAFRWQPTADYSGKTVSVRVAATDDEGAESIQSFNIHVAKATIVEDDPSVPLIATIDVKRDVVSGASWRLLDGAISVAKEAAPRITLMTTPNWPQYVLASNIQVDGRALAAGLLADDRQILAVLGSTRESSGLRAKDGSLVGGLELEGDSPVASGRKTDVRYIVHNSGVLVTCDGKPAIDWRGDWAELADPGPQWSVPSDDKLFIGADQSDCSWTTLRFEPVDDDALETTLAKISFGQRGETSGTLPDAAEIAKARELAVKAFGGRIRSAQPRPELEKTLEKVRAAMRGERVSPAEKYVLTTMAIEVTALIGRSQEAVDLIDEMETAFGVNSTEQYLEVLAKMMKSRHNTNKNSQAAIANTAASLLPDLIRDEKFLDAYKIANLSLQAARKGHNTKVTKRVVAQKKEILALGRMHQQMVDARKRLESEPDNRAANTVLGRWEAFVQGRWPVGLRQLAKGDQAMLKAIAVRDLAEPADAATQYKLALDWYHLARKTEGRMQHEITKRAAFWYEIALPRMSTLQKEAIPTEFKLSIAAITEVKAQEPIDKEKSTDGFFDVGNLPDGLDIEVGPPTTPSSGARYLVGFVATSRPFSKRLTCVASLQPVYRRVADGRVEAGPVYGTPFENKQAIVAREGFAVGAVDMRVGALINGFSLRFYKALPTGLSGKDSYRSPWYCDRTGRRDQRGDSGRKFITGVTVKQSNDHIASLEIITP